MLSRLKKIGRITGEYSRFLGKFQVNTLECIITLNSLTLFEMFLGNILGLLYFVGGIDLVILGLLSEII